MAIYQFVNENGTIMEREYPMKDGPPEEILIDGELFARVFTVPGISIPPNGVSHSKDKMPVSRALPRRNTKNGTDESNGVVEYRDGLKTDTLGRPLVANKADEKNWSAATGYKLEK